MRNPVKSTWICAMSCPANREPVIEMINNLCGILYNKLPQNGLFELDVFASYLILYLFANFFSFMD